MRVQLFVAAAATIGLGAAPAAAQGQSGATQNQTAATKSADKKQPAADEEKICKRTANGKVCMTAKKWREYQEMF